MSGLPVAGTPATEWTEQTLAALNKPTAQTGGYVEPFSPVDPSSINTGIIPPSAPVGNFATGVSPVHASGSIPSRANFAAGVGPSHASGDIPAKAAYAQGFVTGGGLASSPNVQAIAAQSAASAHSEGLTRAELAANKVKAAQGEDLSALSGRDQAAAQLAQLRLSQEQTGPAFGLGGGAGPGAETPGLEVPGGWGLTKAPHPETSLYQDVTQALHGVGTAAFSVLPKGVVESLSTTSSPTTSTTPATGGGIGSFLSSVKNVVSEITQDVKSEFAATHQGTASNTSPATLRTVDRPGAQPKPLPSGQDLLKQAQNIFLEGVHKVEALAGSASTTVANNASVASQKVAETASAASQQVVNTASSVSQQAANAASSVSKQAADTASTVSQQASATAASATQQVSKATGIPDPLASTTNTTALPATTTAIAPATSLPTDEFAGARPGEHSDGVGALPGSAAETGVAILPEERRVGADVTLLPSSEIKGNREGDHFDGVGALPGGTADTGVAVLPDELAEPSPAKPSTATPFEAAPTAAFASTPSEATRTADSPVDREPPVVQESSGAPTPSTASTGTSTPSNHSDFVPRTYNPEGSGPLGLAAPLGAFREATPLPAPDLSKETHIPSEIGTAIAAKPVATIPVAELETGGKTVSPEPSRMDSFTSTTAVLHGVAGDRETSKVPLPQSSLRQVSEAPVDDKPLPAAPAPRFSSFETDHKVPGTEHGAVGSAVSSQTSPSGTVEAVKEATKPHTTTASTVSPTQTPVTATHTPASPASGVSHSDAAVGSHHRTESGSSTGKKSGFLSKIKAKLHHEKS